MCCGNQNTNYVVVGSGEKVCINPVSFILSKALRENQNNGTAIDLAIQDVLSRGYVSKNNTDFCCPDCTEPSGFYFLGSAAAFTTLVNDLPTWSQFTGSIECCLNYEGSISASGIIQTALDTLSTEPDCCTSTFRNDLNDLQEKFEDFAEILDLGVVEISTLNFKSSISEILNAIIAVNQYAGVEEILEVFTEILTVGVFVKCDDCSIVITNTASAIATAESIF